MTKDLIPVRTIDLMPTVAERAADVEHVPRNWGARFIPPVPLEREPPEPAVLHRMDEELAMGLMPASAFPGGSSGVTRYATMLVESFPMRDQSGDLYADTLLATLLECPPDYLPKLVRHIIRTSIHRPAAAEVVVLIEAELDRRDKLQRKVQAALRYWAWKAEKEAAAAEPVVRVDVPRLDRMPIPAGRRKQEREPEAKPPPKPSYIATAKFIAETAAKAPDKPQKT